MTESRIPPRPLAEWDDAVDDALAVLRPPAAAGERPPQQEQTRPASNIVATFAWHPALMKGWLQFNNHLFASTLTDRAREMVTVRIGYLRRAEYEWSQHMRIARLVGLNEAEIDGLMEGPDAAVWGAHDAALLRATDELANDHYISDETWAELSKELDRQQLMDLVFTVGSYDLLALAFNTFGLELDPGMERFPDGTTS